MNSYSRRAALVLAAWDALVHRDSDDISLKHLADQIGTTPPAVYRHFPDKAAIFAEVAAAGLSTLLVNLEPASEPSAEDFVNAWIRFADNRPRHYALMFSIRFSKHEGVSLRMNALSKSAHELAARRVGDAAQKTHGLTLFAMIHGAASLAASGLPRQPLSATLQAVEAYLLSLRR